MTEFKLEILKSQQFNSALTKLMTHTKFHPKVAMRIARLVDQIKAEEIKAFTEYQALISAHAKLDDKGAYVPKENSNGEPIPNTFQPKDMATWEKAFEAFGQKTFKVDIQALPIKDLEGLGLNAMEFSAIEPLITETKLVEAI